MVTIVAAVARNGCIGKDGALPWRIPEDMKRYQDDDDGQGRGHGAEDLGIDPGEVSPAPRPHERRRDPTSRLSAAGRSRAGRVARGGARGARGRTTSSSTAAPRSTARRWRGRTRSTSRTCIATSTATRSSRRSIRRSGKSRGARITTVSRSSPTNAHERNLHRHRRHGRLGKGHADDPPPRPSRRARGATSSSSTSRATASRRRISWSATCAASTAT